MQILSYILLAIYIIAVIYLIIISFYTDLRTYILISSTVLVILYICTGFTFTYSLANDEEKIKSKYTVIGVFRQTNEDCGVETLSDLSYDEAMKIKSEWKKQEKYEDVFYFKQD